MDRNPLVSCLYVNGRALLGRRRPTLADRLLHLTLVKATIAGEDACGPTKERSPCELGSYKGNRLRGTVEISSVDSCFDQFQ